MITITIIGHFEEKPMKKGGKRLVFLEGLQQGVPGVFPLRGSLLWRDFGRVTEKKVDDGETND